jgi:hypothetical protein
MDQDDMNTRSSDRDGHADPNWPYPPFRFRIGGRVLSLPSFRPAPGWDDPHPWPIVCWGMLGGRPLDWRWRLGIHRGTPRWAVRDPWLGRVRGFRRAANRAGSPLAPELSRGHPEIAAACRLRAADDPLQRVEVECRLLAGQDDDAIARACGLDPGVVAAYAAVFHAIRERLECRPPAEDLLIPPPPLDGADTVERALKVVSHAGGPIALESALDALRHGLEDPAADADRLRLRTLVLGTIALMILPMSVLGPARVVVLHRLNLELEEAADRAGVFGPARREACAWIRGASQRQWLFDMAEEPARGPIPETAAPSVKDRLVG